MSSMASASLPPSQPNLARLEHASDLVLRNAEGVSRRTIQFSQKSALAGSSFETPAARAPQDEGRYEKGRGSLRRVLSDAIAARRLRSIKRSVCSTIKLGVVPVIPPFGETNRNCNRHGATGAVDREFAALCRSACTFSDPRRFGGVGARHHDDEFLSTQTADEVAAPNRLLKLTAETLEHAIADIVAIGVVHALEMVDVENHHGQRRASRACGFDHRRQAALERATIVEPGQRVVKRHLYRLLNGLAQSIRIKLLPDVCPHPGQELVSVDRAREIVIGAEFEPAKHLRAIVWIGNEQDRQIARALVRAGLTAQPQTVEPARP